MGAEPLSPSGGTPRSGSRHHVCGWCGFSYCDSEKYDAEKAADVSVQKESRSKEIAKKKAEGGWRNLLEVGQVGSYEVCTCLFCSSFEVGSKEWWRVVVAGRRRGR